MRIAIVAGEASGDLLAAGLVAKLKNAYPDAIIEGIAGPRMIAAGCHALFSIHDLSVIGLFEIIKHLPRLLRIRKQLLTYFSQHRPDIFIGVDAPDFNLPIELLLRRKGVPTIHYNSPTVWAWRKNRLKKIAHTTDLMLVLYPFEKKIYEERALPVNYVGHPLADIIPEHIDNIAARDQLKLPAETVNKKIIAIMPGSRMHELNCLARLFFQVAEWCYQRDPNIIFVTPMVNVELKTHYEKLVQQYAAHLPFHILLAQSHDVLAAADVVLLASGTATLEAMLHKKPMVVAYRLSGLTYSLVKYLVKTPYVALPNLLANKLLVPELIQDNATVENLGEAVMQFLQQPERVQQLKNEFAQLHQTLRCNTDERAFEAVRTMLDTKKEK